MGGGVAMFDYDNDGRVDLFFVNGAQIQDPMPRGASPDKSDPRFWNRLYRNNGDGTFTGVTEAAGMQGHSYGMGVAVGDYDNDGNTALVPTWAEIFFTTTTTAHLPTSPPKPAWAEADGAPAPASSTTIAMAAPT